MGTCASNISEVAEHFHKLIVEVDTNDIEAVKKLLVICWSVYGFLSKEDRYKLDSLAKKLNTNHI